MTNTKNKTVYLKTGLKLIRVRQVNGITEVDQEDQIVKITRLPKQVFLKYLELNVKYKIDTVTELSNRQFLAGAIWSQIGEEGEAWFHKINELQPNYNDQETDVFFKQTKGLISSNITYAYMNIILEAMRLLAKNSQFKTSQND